MATLTFVTGIERFNAHVWTEVESALADAGVTARLLRFNDDHVDRQDPALAAAIQASDVVFMSLINMRSQADWLGAQIARANPAAVFAYESMPEVMGLTRVGDYRVRESKGGMPKPMKVLMRLITRGRDEDALYAYTKLVKVTARLLPLIPEKLGGFRTWLAVNLYWNQPDAANIVEMVKLILRDTLKAPVDVAPVRVIPTMGCFDPEGGELFADPPAYLKWARKQGRIRKEQPLVAVLAMRKHAVQRMSYLTELCRSLESRGLGVLPVFVSGIEAHVAVREWLVQQPIEAFISTMGFSVVGGPASSTKPGQYHETAADLLARLDAPYFVAQPLLMQEERDWHARGVHSMQSVAMYDLPEMDGVAATVALGAIRDGELATTADRLDRAAEQAASWIRLRRKPAAERRIAVVLYNFPPGLGKVGTAALLDVPASLAGLTERLHFAGYRTGGAPVTADAASAALARFAEGSATRTLPVADYRQLVPPRHAERIDRFWGPAPGDIAAVGRDGIRLDVQEFGNVLIGVQPTLGIPGDPMKLLFNGTFTPHHQFTAFYRWLKDGWKADAIIHLGMHGTAEWMPGLQAGLTGDCWPDLLLGGVPHLYVYPLNNPAEAAIARRRGYATVVSHAVPPYARAGLYQQLAKARDRLAAPDDPLDALLPELPRHDGESRADYAARATAYLASLEQRLIVDGLHVLGQSPEPARAFALVDASLDVGRNGQAGLRLLLAAALPASVDRQAAARRLLLERCVLGGEDPARVWSGVVGQPVPPGWAALVAEGRAILAGLARCGEEFDALLHALDGGYVRPAYGADPVRAGSGALPSGRNIHGIDPWRLPTESALERGRRMAELLLAQHREQHGGYPRTVAQTLWAMDTIKNEGESIGAILALVGAEPERDGQGKIFRYRLLPLEQVAHPRIDVLLDISAVFRDTFQMTVDLLDQLFRVAATADEAPDCNFLRANAQALLASGRSADEATARIFTQAPGLYGTGVDELIEESQWEEPTELADMYLRRNAHAYGGGRNGTAAPEVLKGLLGTVDHVFQAIDSVEYGLTDMQHYYGHSGAVQMAAKQARGSDVPLSYAETWTGEVSVNTAADLLRVEARTKLLNPRWYEGMLAHGHSGAAEIGTRFTHLVGWGAVGPVDQWVFDGAAQTYLLDDAMRRRLEAANPQAVRNAVSRMMEASGRGMWQADEATLSRLQGLYADLEDRLEGVSSGTA